MWEFKHSYGSVGKISSMIQLLNVLTFRLEIIIVVNPHLLIMDSVIPVYIYIY